MLDEAGQWELVCRRDRAGDGSFVFAVVTTGIYCRPGCGARRPLRENVRFFADGAAARGAGFRACRRCRPDEVAGDITLVERVCAAIDAAEAMPRLDALGALVGLSGARLARVFASVTGLSPRAWGAAARARRVAVALADGASVTSAIHEAGYGSSSRFYEDDALGMTPQAWRAGGEGERIWWNCAPCSLGWLLVARTGRGVCAVSLGEAPEPLLASLQARLSRAEFSEGDASYVAAVVALVEEPARAAALPLDLRGTAFQIRVWRALRDIKSGETVSYAVLAARLGMERGARAVARACATNEVAVLVPCHRVLRGDGSLAGYRWGLARKRSLLARESS